MESATFFPIVMIENLSPYGPLGSRENQIRPQPEATAIVLTIHCPDRFAKEYNTEIRHDGSCSRSRLGVTP